MDGEFHVHLVVVRDLPATPDTLLLRLLDSGKRLQGAMSELDAQQARVNGLLDAWGYRMQADTQRAQASVARRNSVLGPLGGLLGTGASLLSMGRK